MEKHFCLEIVAPAEDCDKVLGCLALKVNYGWEEHSVPEGGTLFRIFNDRSDYLEKLASQVVCHAPECIIKIHEEEKRDWLEAWRNFFTPIECGNSFLVLPPWLASGHYGQRIAVIIEPKSAFGTGHHATTAVCLEIVDELFCAGRIRAGQNFLDLGTGSGILGIACCKLGLRGVGLDVDPMAIDNARENANINRVKDFDISISSLEIVAGHRFDLIMANILAKPLEEMAPLLVKKLQDGGCIILSGLLANQADQVENAYKACGLPDAVRKYKDEWAALLWA